MEVCPTEALIRAENGVVKFVAEECTSCGECVEACQYGMIQMDQDTDLAVKCDYCDGDPLCVSECEFGAILFQEVAMESQKSREAQMKVTSNSNLPFQKRHDIASVFLKETRGIS